MKHNWFCLSLNWFCTMFKSAFFGFYCLLVAIWWLPRKLTKGDE